MTTKHRFRDGRYRLEVREKDHLPMHVHLTGGGIDLRVDLVSATTHGGGPAGLRREVLAWIAEHRDELIREWKRWHP